MDFLIKRIHREKTANTVWISGIPIAELDKLALKDLLKLLCKLGEFELRSKGKNGQLTILEKVKGALAILENWPVGFHRFLRTYDEKFNGNALTTPSFYKRFSKFYKFVFNASCTTEAYFMRDEFIRFGSHVWGGGVISQKTIKAKDDRPRYISSNVLADRLNVRQTTLIGWAKHGLIPVTTLGTGKKIRYVFDSTILPTIETGEGRVLNMREAAAHIGIPVSALKMIVQTESFSSKFKIRFKMGIHEADLDNLRVQLLNRTTPISKKDQLMPDTFMSLRYFMQEKRLHSKTGKGNFLTAYLAGQITAIGRVGDTVGDILFERATVEDFAKKYRSERRQSEMLLSEAADLIGCQPYSVPSLIRNAYLKSVIVQGQPYVSRDSVNVFLKQYVCLAHVAKSNNTSTRNLLSLAKNMSIHVESIHVQKYPSAHFIDIADVTQLFEQFDRCRKVRHAKETNCIVLRKDDLEVSVFRSYIDRLKLSGKSLPRRAGQPNKSAIARACNINRDCLYDNHKLIDMLTAYEMEERNRPNMSIKDEVSRQLRRYLNQLKKLNCGLPQRNGKPNLKQIAKACGISRSAFYNSPALRGLIDNFDQ